jgi:hypothetical protein
MLAAGLDYKNYQAAPDHLAVAPFVQDIAAKYGVRLNRNAQAQLGRIFNNKELIGDPAKFAPAVVDLLRRVLTEKRETKSLKSIAGRRTATAMPR